MEIRTLEHTSIADLTTAFNAGFEGYFIKLHLSEEQMQERIATESIDLSLSIGMFDGDSIVGFILTGIDTINGVLTANNAGTGVVSAHRGQGITMKLYDVLLPLLKEKAVQKCVLEVITNNEVAIHLYEKVGYSKERRLDCYKMNGALPGTMEVGHRIAKEFNAEWRELCDVAPAWQYSNTAISKTKDKKVIKLIRDDRVVAAAVCRPSTGRVMFFSVASGYRKQGLGTALFELMVTYSDTPLSVINIDSSDAGIKTCLEKMGMVYFLSQYEMGMDLK